MILGYISTNTIVEEVLSKVKGRILDVGCGHGRSIKFVNNACHGECYIIGLDVNCRKLNRALEVLRNINLDLICANALNIPLRSNSIDAVMASLVLHEVEVGLVDLVVEEAFRVLRGNGVFIVMDKVVDGVKTPSEKLTILTENVRFKVWEYVYGCKPWGIRSSNEIVGKIVGKGFEKLLVKIVDYGGWMSGIEFAKIWGRETLKLVEKIANEERKREIISLIEEIKAKALKYGYGPAKMIIAIFRKPKDIQ